MKTIGLPLFFVVCSLFAKAQHTVAPGFEQTNYPQFAINFAVLGNSLSAADAYFEEGERYERLGDHEEAVSLFNKAAARYQEQKKLGRYGVALIKLSNAHLGLGNFNEAENIVLKQVLKNYTRMGSKAGQMSAYQQLGKVYFASNKLTQSLWFYTQQGILASQLNDKYAYIESVLGIAAVKIKKKDYLLASRDLNTAELLSKSANTLQFNKIIKSNRAVIAEKTAVKKS